VVRYREYTMDVGGGEKMQSCFCFFAHQIGNIEWSWLTETATMMMMREHEGVLGFRPHRQSVSLSIDLSCFLL